MAEGTIIIVEEDIIAYMKETLVFMMLTNY